MERETKKMQRQNDDRKIVTFSDMLLILKQSKSKIVFWTLCIAALAMVFTLIRTPKYQGEATFREKAKTASDSGKPLSLAVLAGSGDANENAAVSLMKSRKLSEKVAKEKNLQATLRKDVWSFNPFKNIKNNLKVEWAYLREIHEPVIESSEELIKAADVKYGEEIPLKLKVKFTSEDTYLVFDQKGKEVGQGALNVLFSNPSYSFKLIRSRDGGLSKIVYKLTLDPLPLAAKKISKRFNCTTDSKDKTLLKLVFRDQSRQDASDCLNVLMHLYQEELKKDHQKIVKEQIAYLEQRQTETASKLKTMMEEHAQALSSNMATIDFLFQMQQSYTQKLLLLDMELRRLLRGREEGDIVERYWFDSGDPSVVGQLLNEIRSHRQQADSIDIVLRKIHQENPEKFKKSFDLQLAELEDVKACSEEIKRVLAALEGPAPLPLSAKLENHSKYRVIEWQTKVDEYKKAFNKAPPTEKREVKKSLDACVSSYKAYLTNLIHLLDVEEKIIQERLTHQQCPQSEFQGIDLVTANQLYINYSKTLNEIEAQILHYAFILDQMKDPHFEPSSLSSILDDPVSQEIVTKASNLVLLVKDQENRSPREIDRLKTEIGQQKGFLSMHIAQTMQLINQRKNLYQEKILSLQNVQLELIHQRISVLEQHLMDLIDSRINSLKQEKEAIEQQQLILQQEMAKMPAKWASEKLIDQHLEMSRRSMEEITRIVETKNCSAHLDISQSAPMDVSVSPIHPIRPHVVLFTILGALLGLFASMGFAIGKALVKGVPATQDNLKLSHCYVAGVLSNSCGGKPGESLLDEDLNVLRRLVAHLCSNTIPGISQTLLLLINKGEDYSANLCTLLGRSGSKILSMPISFECSASEKELPGLLQYLEGKTSFPKIFAQEWYDGIYSGGFSRYSDELVHSSRFEELIKKLQETYPWIVVVSTVDPATGEAEHLVKQFDRVAISVNDETLEELKPIIDLCEGTQGKSLSFVFTQSKQWPFSKNY